MFGLNFCQKFAYQTLCTVSLNVFIFVKYRRSGVKLQILNQSIGIKLYFRPNFVNISFEFVTLEEHLNTVAFIS